MAFDAGMVAAAAKECRAALGARVDRVCQPDHDEVVLILHAENGQKHLLLSARPETPRFGFTSTVRENPKTAPTFCMLLRKHLGGAHLVAVEQAGFERTVRFVFDTRDEMGYKTTAVLVIEVMGKYSNLIFLDEHDRVLAVLRPVDFSMSQKRQVLPGMQYELPPPQDKRDPTRETREGFEAALRAADPDTPADRYLLSTYLGLSRLSVREIVFCAAGRVDAEIGKCVLRRLSDSFFSAMERIASGAFLPTLLTDADGCPIEYSWFPITLYGKAVTVEQEESFGALFDRYFVTRDRINRITHRAHDISHLLSNAQARLERKLSAQREELAACEKKESYRKMGDLITANIWQLTRGMTAARLTDYTTDPPGTEAVKLDGRLSPADNAQAYYKLYAKAKTAEKQLAVQIAAGEGELLYLATVSDSLQRAETEADLDEIRAELYESGYASRMKQYRQKKLSPCAPLRFRTTDGMRVLAGKNNRQNEEVTHKLAAKNDLWFHIKNSPGAHVVLLCGDEEPTDRDYSEAAMLAATLSGGTAAAGVAVDYTRVRNLKKPPAAKPGMVIYHTNYTAYVKPDAQAAEALRDRKGEGKGSR